MSLSTGTSGESGKAVEKILAEFNKSWMTYWDAYVALQDQLYEEHKGSPRGILACGHRHPED